jgi:hypothetical protein
MTALNVLPVLLLALPVFAQGDSISLASGDRVDGVKVLSYELNELKYQKGGRTETVSSDQVAKVDVGRFDDVYKRPIAEKDPDKFVNIAKEQVKSDPLVAQLGYLAAANLYLARGDNANVNTAFACLEEMRTAVPTGGYVPAYYRLKFETYMGRNDAKNADVVAKKYHNEAVSSVWPQGYQLEGEFFQLLADGSAGGIDKRAYQSRLRELLGRAGGFPMLTGRINVQLANSLRETGDKEGARKIYKDLVDKDSTDVNSRAGSYLGLGQLAMDEGDANNREPFRQALLDFLRVRIETKECWGSLQAEALYDAMIAAERWGGENFAYIGGKCKFILTTEFKTSEWAAKARGK